jgi:hypothetical protein
MKLHAIAIQRGIDGTYTFYGELLDENVILPRYVVPRSNDTSGYLGVKALPKSGYKRWTPVGDHNSLSLDVDGNVHIHSDDGIYTPHFPLSFDEDAAKRSIREDYASMLIAYHSNLRDMLDSDTHIVGMRLPAMPDTIVFKGDMINMIFGVPQITLTELREFTE